MSDDSLKQNKINQFKQLTNVKNDEIAADYLNRNNWDCAAASASWTGNADVRAQDSSISRNFESIQDSNLWNGFWGYDFVLQLPGVRQLNWLGARVSVEVYPWIQTVLGTMASLSARMVSMVKRSSNGKNYGSVRSYRFCYRQFLSQYGSGIEVIFSNSKFRTALETAKQKQCCIMIYFHTATYTNKDEHQQHSSHPCDLFVTNILTNESVQAYILHNMVAWMADLRYVESAHLFRQIAIGMGPNGSSLDSIDEPLIAIVGIHPEYNRLVLLERALVDPTQVSPMEFVCNVLDQGIQKWQEFKLKLIREEEERSASRLIREQQEKEYEELLRKELERQQRDSEDNGNPLENMFEYGAKLKTDPKRGVHERDDENEEDEEVKKLTQLRCQQRIEHAKSKLNSEPVNSSDSVKVRIHLPNGTKLERQFQHDDAIEQIFYFVESHDLRTAQGDIVEDWELIRTFPHVFKYEKSQLTLRQLGITSSINLFVQQVF
ncbi:hypothetical protein RFI_28945 [Reticulomyxa filosa]|uniref:UBX domain-containing protein n=1 Tax=Reticulomyxa filosa TaxID=46433 RepID=X6M399_RETFI|nr:hypothetical protein RFI_28945 [Reticulomyxa filosa]|eukprot:ETO08443.1 hypothetical protein RFI_28945 [Reticulomyxa filosa]